MPEMTLDPHKLEHLVAVAEEGSFTRAAARLHLSQQALSTSIRSLEREVGVPLLERRGNTVAALAAGQALVADARVLRGLTHSALRRARQIGRGDAETLRVGHTPAVTTDEVSALVHQAHAEYPAMTVEVNQRYPAEITTALLDGDLELGLCRAMTPEHGLTRSTLTRHRLRLAVPGGHHLALRENVDIAELATESIMVWGTPGRSGYTDLLIEHCRKAGFEPRIHRNPVQGTPPVTAALGAEHVAFVTAGPGHSLAGQVRVIELEPPLFVPLHALWPQHTTSPARDAFLRACS